MNTAAPTDDSVADDMSIDGFLSPMLHDYIPNIIEAHPAWFDFARRLNRHIVSMWLQHPITTEGLLPLDPEPLAVRLPDAIRACASSCRSVASATMAASYRPATSTAGIARRPSGASLCAPMAYPLSGLR